MALEQSWRWFGPKDPITLNEIKQTGVSGIVTALHHLPTGSVWSVEEILNRKKTIEAHGLTWSVVESIPVHEDIKLRRGNFQSYLENYKQSIRNLGRCGIDIVCYNFMPLLDWSRTDLEFLHSDGSITTKFEETAFAAFDLFILQRPHAEDDYPQERIQQAVQYFQSLSQSEKEKLRETVLLGFPGSLEAYSLDQLRTARNAYDDLSKSDYRDALIDFIREVAPVAEESHVRLAIHPDDPPWPLLGLPRVVSTEDDLSTILSAYDSPANGLTFCTGSLGARATNNVAQMANRFARRIQFAHLRNVSITGDRSFVESDHLDGVVQMYDVVKSLVLEQKRRTDEGSMDARLPFRPDHGRLTAADVLLAKQKKQDVYPGYSFVGRMRALAELRGLELGIRRALGL